MKPFVALSVERPFRLYHKVRCHLLLRLYFDLEYTNTHTHLFSSRTRLGSAEGKAVSKPSIVQSRLAKVSAVFFARGTEGSAQELLSITGLSLER